MKHLFEMRPGSGGEIHSSSCCCSASDGAAVPGPPEGAAFVWREAGVKSPRRWDSCAHGVPDGAFCRRCDVGSMSGLCHNHQHVKCPFERWVDKDDGTEFPWILYCECSCHYRSERDEPARCDSCDKWTKEDVAGAAVVGAVAHGIIGGIMGRTEAERWARDSQVDPKDEKEGGDGGKDEGSG